MHLISQFHAIRRLWLFAMLNSCFAICAQAQKITLSVDRYPLEKVFALIENQSGYSFIYGSEMMAGSKPVTLNVKDVRLVRVLDICLNDQPLIYTVVDKHIIIKLKPTVFPSAGKKTEPVRGRVVSDLGEPLQGISIVVKGSQQGTVTDKNGDFAFDDVAIGTTIIVSGAEIESIEKVVTDRSFIFIRAYSKIGSLDETVVIAYGKTKRRYLTESVSRVKGEELTRQTVSNPILALGGKVSGLQVVQNSGVPGSSISVQLRGRNSIDNGNDPLYIIDGVPFPSESLHDALGAGGGIFASPLDNLNPSTIESIEVLKDAAATAIYGSRGANGVILITTRKGVAGSVKFNLTAYAGVGRITREFDFLNTPEYLAMRREAFANDGSTPNNSNAPDLKVWDTTRYTDWQKMLIGNRMELTDINASVSGGSLQTKFLIGTGYRKETSVFPGDFHAGKISGMGNISHQSADQRFSLFLTTSFLQNRSRLPREDLTNAIRTAPNAPPIYQGDGKLNWQNSTWNNPWSKVMQVFTTRSETWQSNLQIGYHLKPGLELKLSGGYTSLSQDDHFSIPAASLNPAFGFGANAGFGRKNIRTLIMEPQLLYSFNPAKNHHLDVLGGASFQQSIQAGLHQQASGYTSDELLNSASAAASVNVLSESDIKYRYSALFGRINYDYARKYLFTFTLRNDGSSRYAPADRFATFGSVGLGWIFTKEDFFPKNKWFSFGKLRLTAGTTGNDQIGDYRYLDLYKPYDYPYLGATTFAPVQLYSPSYGWEMVKKLEAGLDLSFWSDRLSLTVNYYHNTTSNQLVNYTLPGTTGFIGVLKNLPATIRNNGLELELSAQLVKRTSFKWTAGFNLTIPKNKLVEFENFASSTYASTYALGQPLSIVKTYHYLEVDPNTGVYRFEDLNADGAITTPVDRQTIINTSRQFFGGLSQSFQSGRFTLHVHFQFSGQRNARNYIAQFTRPGTLNNQPAYVLDRWQKPGQETSIQKYTVSASVPNRAYSAMQSSDAAFSNASFVRLRNLQLFYQVPLPKKLGTEAGVFIQGQNLLTITDYKGLDPETLTLLPPVRVLTAGIQLTF